ncbi:Prolyl 4-hydroxylase alpha subunit [Penicillium bovifimosum]|uniref:Prolyl 4-hydroxylase alpha subunit n=1 Tax=Penicillium bovifimosum TaxID=126998 RepID=A0A9W9L922_9EURO|nr:Prolyl 4-hydroxylase alpha subunit [Penicillium bovifimosum]KAJ5142952.1 Prolyl 4-hydroxylase alpha subunit [Penicillium bovifimosum]
MTDQNIPDTFLRGPSPNATLHKLDFTQTNPPIPKFKDNFAAIVNNLLTETECKELLRVAEDSTRTVLPNSTLSPPTWERAMINAGGGKQIMSVDSRKSGRVILDSPDLAARILDRLMPFMRECGIDRVTDMPMVTGLGPAKRGEVLRLTRLNERMRFLRYEGGDYFRPHWDGCYVTPDGREKSLFTVHLYLNGDGEQDVEELERRIEKAEKEKYLWSSGGEVDLAQIGALEVEDGGGEEGEGEKTAVETLEASETLLGGATSFMAAMNSKEVVRVFPRTGSVLIFQQRNLFHSGDDVFRGVKYTVRTDVMYATE